MPEAEPEAEQLGDLPELWQSLQLLQEELRGGLSEQAALRRRAERLEQAAAEAREQRAALELRLAGLEREREAADLSSAQAFETFSVRLTEMGVELASWPPAAEVRAALSHTDCLAAEAAERREELKASMEESYGGLRDQLHALEAEVRSCRGDCDAAAQGLVERCKQEAAAALEQAMEEAALALQGRAAELEEALERSAQEAAEALDGCRGDLRTVAASLGECRQELRQRLQSLAWRVFGGPCEEPPEPAGAALAARLAGTERQLEELRLGLQSKADVGHTHDRLVSADGTLNFTL